MTSRTFTVSGIAFNTLIEGPDGAPFVVLSNSLATNLTLWDSLAASLSDRYRVFRYDQRGHGGTTATPPPYSMPQLVDDLVGLLDAAGIGQAHFVGISMGGVTGYGLAGSHRKRLSSLTVCDAAPAAAASGDWDKRLEIVRAQGLSALVEPTLERWFTKASMAADTPAVRKVREMVRTTSETGFTGCVNALQTYDYAQVLDGLDLPVLLVAGAFDGVRPQSMAEDVRRIPGARLAIIPDAGHLSNVENEAEFNRVVGAFIDRVQARS